MTPHGSVDYGVERFEFNGVREYYPCQTGTVDCSVDYALSGYISGNRILYGVVSVHEALGLAVTVIYIKSEHGEYARHDALAAPDASAYRDCLSHSR